MSDVKILNKEGLEFLSDIPDNSIDLILTDPPYITSRKSGMDKWVDHVARQDSSGSINIYDQSNSFISSFECGISPGVIVFDVRTLTTSISEEYLSNNNSSQYFDLLGKEIDNEKIIKDGVYIKDNTLLFITK